MSLADDGTVIRGTENIAIHADSVAKKFAVTRVWHSAQQRAAVQATP